MSTSRRSRNPRPRTRQTCFDSCAWHGIAHDVRSIVNGSCRSGGEGVAASIMNTDRWNPSILLMRPKNPSGWDTLAAEIYLIEPNHALLTGSMKG